MELRPTAIWPEFRHFAPAVKTRKDLGEAVLDAPPSWPPGSWELLSTAHPSTNYPRRRLAAGGGSFARCGSPTKTLELAPVKKPPKLGSVRPRTPLPCSGSFTESRLSAV